MKAEVSGTGLVKRKAGDLSKRRRRFYLEQQSQADVAVVGGITLFVHRDHVQRGLHRLHHMIYTVARQCVLPLTNIVADVS